MCGHVWMDRWGVGRENEFKKSGTVACLLELEEDTMWSVPGTYLVLALADHLKEYRGD